MSVVFVVGAICAVAFTFLSLPIIYWANEKIQKRWGVNLMDLLILGILVFGLAIAGGGLAVSFKNSVAHPAAINPEASPTVIQQE